MYHVLQGACIPAVDAGVLGGEVPQGNRGVWGGAGPSVRERYNSYNVLKCTSLLGQKICKDNLGGRCANFATFRRVTFSYK